MPAEKAVQGTKAEHNANSVDVCCTNEKWQVLPPTLAVRVARDRCSLPRPFGAVICASVYSM